MRDVLRGLYVGRCSHLGLAYDVWAPVEEGTGKVGDAHRQEWLEGLCRIKLDPSYADAYRRWEESFVADGLCQPVETTSRLLVGHGNPSGTDVGLTVHHTWGVPMIPGSALAGVLAHYVDAELAGPRAGWAREPERARWRGPTYRDGVVVEAPGDRYACLFGAPELAGDRGARGLVTFCDALWVPEPERGRSPWVQDVLTVHQKAYYGGQGAVPPTDHDDPTPVSFLGVGKGVQFLLALCGPAEWTAVAMSLLLDALAWRGVGGKTSAGYGRLRAVERRAVAAGRSERREAEPRPAPARTERAELGEALRAFAAWLEGHKARKTHARELVPAIEQEWAARLGRLEEDERCEAGRRIRKAVTHVDFKDAAKELSRRIEAGDG